MGSRSNLQIWQITNAWREVLARIFEGLEAQLNVSPEWLINPVTNRRLKLDLLYPEIGVAVRFEGLRGKQRKQRLSLEEEVQERARSEARMMTCQEHGIHLVMVDVVAGKPNEIFQQIDTALSRAGRSATDKKLQQKIKAARNTAASLSRKIRVESDLKLYVDLWEDRQYKLSEPDQSQPPAKPTVTFTKGMEVEHTKFGPGVVLSTSPSNGDTLITVDFVTAGQKTLAASLVADKLVPR